MLLRGLQKQVIVLSDTGSEFFEEAIFIVSPKGQGRRECDMVAAAHGILDARLRCARPKKRARSKSELVIAAVLASAATLLVTLLAVGIWM